MSRVYIEGMDMPNNCLECELLVNCEDCEGHELYCAALGEIGYKRDMPKGHRRPDCPLREE